MKVEEKLKNLGLTDNEAKVYFTVINLGSSKAGKISKESGIERSSCYNTLNSLVEKGLVSYAIVKGVKFFQATSPKKLLEDIKEKEDIAKEILPKLYDLHREKKVKGQVRLFKGHKGIKSVLQDIVREGEENCIFGSEGQLEEKMPSYKRSFVRLLKQNDIKLRELIRSGRDDELETPRDIRFIPISNKSPVVTNIYGNKIAIIIWSKPPEAIIIENKDAAKSYKDLFEFMWENAKENE